MKNQPRFTLFVASPLLLSLSTLSPVMADSWQLSEAGSDNLSAGVSVAGAGALSIVYGAIALPVTVVEAVVTEITSVQDKHDSDRPAGQGFPIADEIITFSPQASNDE